MAYPTGQQSTLNASYTGYDPLELEMSVEADTDGAAPSRPLNLKDAGMSNDARNRSLKYASVAERIT